MVYDWSPGYTHFYFGYSLQWAGGGVPSGGSKEKDVFMMLLQ